MNFAKYKASRKDNFNKLQSKLADMASGKGYQKPEGYWQPTVDAAKNGSAIIRFLPAAKEEDLPYVQVYTHAFKGPGGWYIENCLTTLFGPDGTRLVDPAVEYGNKLWGPKKDPQSQFARDRVSGTPGNPGTKRKNNYHSIIYVVKDPGAKENEGKVFKFQYGPKLFEFLNDAMNPTEKDVEAWSPFDLYEGANFHMRIRQVAGYRNFGKSSWEPRGPLFDDDEKMEVLFNSIPDLTYLVAPDKFKTYDQLKARLNKVLGETANVQSGTVESQVVVQEDTESFQGSNPPWEDTVKETKIERTDPELVGAGEDEETPSDFFQGLLDK